MGLLLALYGAADLIARLCWRLVFAGEGESLVLSVSTGEDAEYRIRRFAAWLRVCPTGFTPTVLLAEEDAELYLLCKDLGLAVDVKNRFTSAEK